MDFYKDTFEYTKERVDSLFKPQVSKEETKKIDIDDTFNRIMGIFMLVLMVGSSLIGIIAYFLN